MPASPDHDDLTRRLRAGDPAAGDPGLDPSERARMRRAILAAGQRNRHTTGWLLPAAAAMAILALALGLALRRPLTPAAGSRPVSSPSVLGGFADAPLGAGGGSQVQFTTDGGTLVVWVLQPRPVG